MKNPNARPAFFILLTLVLSASTLANIMNGSDSAVSAGEHLAAAIVISWVAVRLVSYVVDTYRGSVFRHKAHEYKVQQHQQRNAGTE
jgi:hypothetical protein